MFSDSLAFSASVALFFVAKDPLGPDFGPKQNLKKTDNKKSTIRAHVSKTLETQSVYGGTFIVAMVCYIDKIFDDTKN